MKVYAMQIRRSSFALIHTILRIFWCAMLHRPCPAHVKRTNGQNFHLGLSSVPVKALGYLYVVLKHVIAPPAGSLRDSVSGLCGGGAIWAALLPPRALPVQAWRQVRLTISV